MAVGICRTRWRHVLLAACIAGCGARALAHHSFAAEFDIDKPIELRGRVLKVELVNPHSWIHMDALTGTGARQIWKVEGGNPHQLLRKGFTRNSLPVGTEIQVSGYQARDGGKRVVARTLKLANGQQLFFQPGELPLPAP